MKHLWRKLVSVILALAMVVLCLPEYVRPVKTARAADGDITYTDEFGQTVVLNNKDSNSTNDYIAFGNTTQPPEWTDGKTYVWGDGSMNFQFLTYSGNRVTVNGNVKLVIMSGHTLTISYGIHVPEGSSLTIYGSGTLRCTLRQNQYISDRTIGQAAIGGNAGENAGKITIVGCSIVAEGGQFAAGIGGGRASDRGVGGNCGTVTILGGNVTATGTQGAAGIGGGRNGAGGTIVIKGGTVNATGGSYEYNYGYGSYSDHGAGIGGGSGKGVTSITIDGGTVNATGGNYGAGIGSGSNASSGTIVINGGTVTAKGGNNRGSGIGSGGATGYGNVGNNMSVTINGGTIVAQQGNSSGYYGYGISGNIHINLSDKSSSINSVNYRGSVSLGNPVRIDGTNTIIEATQGTETLDNDQLNQIANKKLVSGRTFTITWLDGNGKVLKSEQVGEGMTPAYSGDTPTKEYTAKYQYSFNNTWDPEIVEASGDATYTAQFDKTIREYSVTFKYRDNDGVFQTVYDTYQYGDSLSAIAPQDIPQEPKSAKYTWTLTGWDFASDAVVTGEATYTAQYNEVINQYLVTLKYLDEKGNTVEFKKSYDYDTAAANILLPENVPTKAVTQATTYTFTGWPEFAAVTENVTYSANYDDAPTQYTITLKYRDASGELKDFVKSYDYNTSATEIALPENVPGTVVTKATTYTFTGWPEFSDVTEDATYVADYSMAATQYTVTLKYLGTDGKYKEYAKSYDYNTPGTDISLPGNVPATVVTKAVTYTLQGWPTFTAVTDDVVYTANYSEAATKYAVKFTYIENEQSKSVEELYDYETSAETISGAAPEVPDRDTEWVYYEFIGWDKKFVSVTDDIEYIAQYKEHTKYGINIGNTPNGVISSDYSTALPNTTITLTLTPDRGYALKTGSLQVLMGSTEIEITDAESSEEIQYTFVMPEGNVDVTAYFYRVYQLWIGETQVTEFNQMDILGDGYVTYVQDEETAVGTLTFKEKNPTIVGLAHIEGIFSDKQLIATAYEVKQLNIVAPNGLQLTSDTAYYGIYATGTSVVFTGDVSVTLNNSSAKAGIQIDSGELSIFGDVSVNLENGFGLYANGSNTVNGLTRKGLKISGNVSVTTKGDCCLYTGGSPMDIKGNVICSGATSNAICASGAGADIEGSVTITNAASGIYVGGDSLSITGNVLIDVSNSGIIIGGGGLTILAPAPEDNKDEVTVKISGTQGINVGAGSSYKLYIVGNVKVTSTNGNGIYAGGLSIEILGNVEVVTDCSGYTGYYSCCGMYAGGGNITVSGNIVVKTKEADGIYASGGNFTCNGNVSVTADGGNGLQSGGGSITIAGNATVTSTGGYGLQSGGGSITITGDVIVTSVGSFGMYAGGGSITCKSDVTVSTNGSYGIGAGGGNVSVTGDVTISSVNGKGVDLSGGSLIVGGSATVTSDGADGIYVSYGYIDVKGDVVISLLNGQGDEYGIYSTYQNSDGIGTKIGGKVKITSTGPINKAFYSVNKVVIENVPPNQLTNNTNVSSAKALDISMVSGSGLQCPSGEVLIQGDVDIVISESKRADNGIEVDGSGLKGLTINGNVTVKMLGKVTEANDNGVAAIYTGGATININGDVDVEALSCSGIYGNGGNVFLTGNVNVVSDAGYGIRTGGYKITIDASQSNQSVTVKSLLDGIGAMSGDPMSITSKGDVTVVSENGYGVFNAGGSITITIVDPDENKARGIVSITSESDGIRHEYDQPIVLTGMGSVKVTSMNGNGIYSKKGDIEITLAQPEDETAEKGIVTILLNGAAAVDTEEESAALKRFGIFLGGSLDVNGSMLIRANTGNGILALGDITVNGDVTIEAGCAAGMLACGIITVVDGVWHVLTEEGIAMCGTDIVIPNTHGIAIPTDGEFAPYTFENPFKEDEEVEGIAVFAPAEDGTKTIATEAMISKFIEITFVDEDENKIKSYNAFQGLRPKFDGEEPKKEKDKQYSYSYGGWTDGENEYAPDELPVVTKPVTYKVVFAKTLNKYTITFLAEDGSKLSEKQYDYGTEAKDIEVPADQKKSDTKELTFVFAGWNDGTNTFKADKIPAVIGDATYKAQFSDTTRNYKVTFVDEDGTTVILAAKEYKYGTKAADITKPADPTKKEDDEFTYEFVGWTPEITDVESDATYKATYKAIAKPGVYYLVGGGTPSVKKGGENGLEMQFKRTVNDNITFDQFDGILINGTELSKDQYTATKGSVIVKISQAYIDSLADGKSELTVKFKDGDPVKVSVEILPAQSSETDPEKTDEKTDSPTSPKTDDTMVLAWLIFLLGVASFTVVLMAKKRDEMAR